MSKTLLETSTVHHESGSVQKLESNGRKNASRSVSESCTENPFDQKNANPIPLSASFTLGEDTRPLVYDSNGCHKKTKRVTVTKVAPDGGWGWMVFIGCIYNTLIITGANSGFPIEFSTRIEGQPTTLVLWTYNMVTFLWFFSFVVTGPITKQFGWRRVGLVFSIGASSAYILLAFFPSMAALFVLYGIVHGLSAGIVYNISLVILPQYFDKRRGLVLCLNVAVVAISQTVTPQIVRVLNEYYGTSGAVLIHGGLFLNMVVACSLFQPVDRHRKIVKIEEDLIVDKIPENIQLQKVRSNAEIILSSSTCSLPGSAVNLDVKTPNETTENDTGKKSNSITAIASEIKKCFLALKSFRVIINASALAVFLAGYGNFMALTPLMMFSYGYGTEDAAWVATWAATASFLGRMLMAAVADRPFFPNKLGYISGATLAAVATMATPYLLWNKRLLVASLCAWGLGVGTGMGLWVVLLIETMGMDSYTAGLGACGLFSAAVTLAAGPLMGLLRDMSTSYAPSVACCAALQLGAAVFWLFMPCAITRDARLHQNNLHNSENK